MTLQMFNHAEWQKQYYHSHPGEKARAYARMTANRAIRQGKLVRQPCARCHAPKVDAHHEDYSKPLEVIWLCRTCHRRFHKGKGIMIVHCTKCQHEWQAIAQVGVCDWCGAPGRQIGVDYMDSDLTPEGKRAILPSSLKENS